MKLAVIPARGGSKRIPRKNVKLFHGRPMIEWSIQAARDSEMFDQIIVSTDDADIADVARRAGATVPYMRPYHLSGDHTPTVPVIAHAVDWVDQNVGPVEHACCIYATAPFIQAKDLKAAFDVLVATATAYCFPVTSFAYPVQRALGISDNGRLKMIYPEHVETRSQDLEEAWHDVGQFYWGMAQAWRDQKKLLGYDSAPYPVPRYRAQDIDTPEDWIRAEHMFSALMASDGGIQT